MIKFGTVTDLEKRPVFTVEHGPAVMCTRCAPAVPGTTSNCGHPKIFKLVFVLRVGESGTFKVNLGIS